MNKKNYQKIMEDLIRENCTAQTPFAQDKHHAYFIYTG